LSCILFLPLPFVHPLIIPLSISWRCPQFALPRMKWTGRCLYWNFSYCFHNKTGRFFFFTLSMSILIFYSRS
jgi:hypothetical protein